MTIGELYFKELRQKSIESKYKDLGELHTMCFCTSSMLFFTSVSIKFLLYEI